MVWSGGSSTKPTQGPVGVSLRPATWLAGTAPPLMPRIIMGFGEKLGLTVTFSKIVWDWAGWTWLIVFINTLAIAPSAKHAVRPIAVLQREMMASCVLGCFTGLCLLTATVSLPQTVTDTLQILFPPASISSLKLARSPFIWLALMPPASELCPIPAGEAAPKTVSSRGREHRRSGQHAAIASPTPSSPSSL